MSKAARLGAACGFVALPVSLALVSAAIGAFPIEIPQILAALVGKADPQTATVLYVVRFPRIGSAALVGAALAGAGAVYQAIFHNPLSSPYTLGVANGAGFGAALAIVLGASSVLVQVSAVGWAVVSVALTFLLAKASRSGPVTLILAGMLVGAFFASLVSFLKFVADPYEKLPQIVFWLMGSISSISTSQLASILPALLGATVVLSALLWRLNAISFDDKFARSIGINVSRERGIALFAASILAAVVISVAGIVGWVGVVIPHFARMIVGNDMREVFGASLSMGATMLLGIDLLARTLTSGELPLGVLTGIVGVPVFLFLIVRGRVSFE